MVEKDIVSMPHKINIVLDDDVKANLETLVESGSRSRVINNALRKELTSIRRRQLSEELDRLRAKTKPVSTEEIVKLIRRDRGRWNSLALWFPMHRSS